MKKLLSLSLSTLMVLGMLSACGSDNSTGTESSNAGTTTENATGSGSDSLVVGCVIMNTSGEWFAEIMQGMEAAGNDLNAEVRMVSSDNEISKESDNISTFIAHGVDAITICPISMDGSVSAVENAQGGGIPVVTWNTTVNSEVESHVGVSNYDLGRLTGEYVAEYVGENFPDGCNLAILSNSSYEIGVERVTGFEDAVKEIPGLEIVAKQDAEMQDEGMDITEQILIANSEVDLIWAWNQTSLVGCATYLESINEKDIIIMGTDMSVELAKVMLDDKVSLQAITTQMPFEIGYNAVANAVKLANEESVEKELSIPLATYTKDDAEGLNKYIEDRQDLVS